MMSRGWEATVLSNHVHNTTQSWSLVSEKFLLIIESVKLALGEKTAVPLLYFLVTSFHIQIISLINIRRPSRKFKKSLYY